MSRFHDSCILLLSREYTGCIVAPHWKSSLTWFCKVPSLGHIDSSGGVPSCSYNAIHHLDMNKDSVELGHVAREDLSQVGW